MTTFASSTDRLIVRTLADILTRLELIDRKENWLMATAAQMKADLVTANEATNEIESDLKDLVAKLAGQGPTGPLTEAESEDVLAQIDTLRDKLRSVAAVYTPATPITPTPGEPSDPSLPASPVAEGGPENKG